MSVSVIIVNYNTGKILKDCIESVYNIEKDISFEIIIVDNNSTDDSRLIIEDISMKHKEIKKIFLDSKISFSGANNKGFENSSGEYILIMNPDIIFTEPVLKKLVNNLSEDNSLGAACPLLIGSDGEFQRRYFQRYPSVRQFVFFYSIFAKLFERSPYLINKYLQNNDMNISSGKEEYTEQIPCAFFLTSREIFLKAGKMNESYQLFFEDVDLSYQINRNHRLAADTSLKVKHLGGESFKTSDDYWLYGRFILSMITFFENNYSSPKTFLLKLLTVTNSYFILLSESVKKISGRKDDYRLRKHKYFLSEFFKSKNRN